MDDVNKRRRTSSRPVEAYDERAKTWVTYESQRHGSRVTGLAPASINKAVNNDRKTAGGMRWRFAKVPSTVAELEELLARRGKLDAGETWHGPMKSRQGNTLFMSDRRRVHINLRLVDDHPVDEKGYPYEFYNNEMLTLHRAYVALSDPRFECSMDKLRDFCAEHEARTGEKLWVLHKLNDARCEDKSDWVNVYLGTPAQNGRDRGAAVAAARVAPPSPTTADAAPTTSSPSSPTTARPSPPSQTATAPPPPTTTAPPALVLVFPNGIRAEFNSPRMAEFALNRHCPVP